METESPQARSGELMVRGSAEVAPVPEAVPVQQVIADLEGLKRRLPPDLRKIAVQKLALGLGQLLDDYIAALRQEAAATTQERQRDHELRAKRARIELHVQLVRIRIEAITALLESNATIVAAGGYAAEVATRMIAAAIDQIEAVT